MTIKVGDTLPDMKLTIATADGPKEESTASLFGGKKVVLFATPGAFTPTCSAKHVPGFVQHADALKAKGVDDNVIMLADGSGTLTKALGLELDLTARGLGIRSQRFALIADNAKVTHLAVEAPGDFDVSRAEAVLEVL